MYVTVLNLAYAMRLRSKWAPINCNIVLSHTQLALSNIQVLSLSSRALNFARCVLGEIWMPWGLRFPSTLLCCIMVNFHAWFLVINIAWGIDIGLNMRAAMKKCYQFVSGLAHVSMFMAFWLQVCTCAKLKTRVMHIRSLCIISLRSFAFHVRPFEPSMWATAIQWWIGVGVDKLNHRTFIVLPWRSWDLPTIIQMSFQE